jgi:hypothetical protein
MCDIDNTQRRKVYVELRKKYNPSFSRRARDFNLTTLRKKHHIVIEEK